jgi:molybdenum cofactor biosynthesis protein MoaC
MQSERDPGGPPPPAASLSSHLNEAGEVHMVDVGAKPPTLRRARAEAVVRMGAATLERLRRGDAPKGDVLAATRLAGIQAAKRTSELIPLCHAIALTKVEVSVDLGPEAVMIHASAEALDRTGVEMEAMVAASVAALTLYDMLKGIERGISYSVRLIEKSGGRSGTWRPEALAASDPG